MKRTDVFIVIFMCFNTSVSYSQTKKDTEDWLLFYLGKYFDKEYLRYRDLINNTYSHETYEYSFYKNIFIVKKYSVNKGVLYLFIDSINLQKVRKVEVGSLEQEDYYDSTVNIYGVKLIFNPFSHDSSSVDNSIKTIDGTTGATISTWRGENEYSLEGYNNLLNDNILEAV